MSEKMQDASYRAGEFKGQAQVEKDQLADKASSMAQSAKDSCQQAAQQVKAAAQGAVETGKDALGMNK